MNACKRCVHWNPGTGKSGNCYTLAESESVFPCIAIDGSDNATPLKVAVFETDGDFCCPLFEAYNFPVTRQLVSIADGKPVMEETG